MSSFLLFFFRQENKFGLSYFILTGSTNPYLVCSNECIFIPSPFFFPKHKNLQHLEYNIHCVLACIIAVNDLSSFSLLLLLKRYYNIFLWLLLTFFPQTLVFNSSIMMCFYAVLFVFILLWNLGTSWICCFIFSFIWTILWH